MASAIGNINDRWFRAIGVPAFGVIGPNATGVLAPLALSDPAYWLSNVYFVLLSGLIWHGNQWLISKQRQRLSWLETPTLKLLVLLVLISLYNIPLSLGAMLLWYHWTGLPGIEWDVMVLVTLIIILCVVFVAHVYETVFLIKARETDAVRVARLEQARIQAELDVLKSQIAPHFLFNSLNTLSHLIETDPARAQAFNDNLARVYRYILLSRQRSLVLLSEELDFLDSYVFLLELRFGNTLRLVHAGSARGPAAERQRERFLIPPISLQILVENAVKHNAFDEAAPLDMTLGLDDEHVSLSNPRRHKDTGATSAGVGLVNLDERCKLITGREIEILATEDRFTVKIPILRISS